MGVLKSILTEAIKSGKTGLLMHPDGTAIFGDTSSRFLIELYSVAYIPNAGCVRFCREITSLCGPGLRTNLQYDDLLEIKFQSSPNPSQKRELADTFIDLVKQHRTNKVLDSDFLDQNGALFGKRRIKRPGLWYSLFWRAANRPDLVRETFKMFDFSNDRFFHHDDILEYNLEYGLLKALEQLALMDVEIMARTCEAIRAKARESLAMTREPLEIKSGRLQKGQSIFEVAPFLLQEIDSQH